MGEMVVTKWSPDTCGCVINYKWDRDSSEDTRVHIYEGHDRRCQDHQSLIEEPLYAVVLEENQRKNLLLQHALDLYPHRFAKTIVRRNGNKINVMKDDLEYDFYFTGIVPRRVFHIAFSESLSDEERRDIEARFPALVVVH